MPGTLISGLVHLYLPKAGNLVQDEVSQRTKTVSIRTELNLPTKQNKIRNHTDLS